MGGRGPQRTALPVRLLPLRVLRPVGRPMTTCQLRGSQRRRKSSRSSLSTPTLTYFSCQPGGRLTAHLETCRRRPPMAHPRRRRRAAGTAPSVHRRRPPLHQGRHRRPAPLHRRAAQVRPGQEACRHHHRQGPLSLCWRLPPLRLRPPRLRRQCGRPLRQRLPLVTPQDDRRRAPRAHRPPPRLHRAHGRRRRHPARPQVVLGRRRRPPPLLARWRPRGRRR